MINFSTFFNPKKRIASIIVISIILCGIAVFSHQDFVDPNPPLLQAPMNPKFMKYLEDQEKGVDRVTYTSDGHPLGLIPDPLDLTYLDVTHSDTQSSARSKNFHP